MQIGVYGAGYMGTIVSACLADFGTPVSCCHPDSSQMVAMAQGNVPFHEKNLTEVIKRNVRSGRLAYSTDIESFARRAQVIFLAAFFCEFFWLKPARSIFPILLFALRARFPPPPYSRLCLQFR